MVMDVMRSMPLVSEVWKTTVPTALELSATQESNKVAMVAIQWRAVRVLEVVDRWMGDCL